MNLTISAKPEIVEKIKEEAWRNRKSVSSFMLECYEKFKKEEIKSEHTK